MIYLPAVDHVETKMKLATAYLRATRAALRSERDIDAIKHLYEVRAAAQRMVELAQESIEALKEQRGQTP